MMLAEMDWLVSRLKMYLPQYGGDSPQSRLLSRGTTGTSLNERDPGGSYSAPGSVDRRAARTTMNDGTRRWWCQSECCWSCSSDGTGSLKASTTNRRRVISSK